MTRKTKSATAWESRHLGNCLIEHTDQGWLVALAHSEGITGPSHFLVPFLAADGRKRGPLAARLARLLRRIVTELGDVRRIGRIEADELLSVPDLGPPWRGRARWYPPSLGNWNRRGRLCPSPDWSGICYLTARTERGWLVLLRSPWGAPRGSYAVPFGQLPFGEGKWEPDFFVRPLRWHLTHLHGTRRLRPDQADRLRREYDQEMLDDAVA
jgi:hypothetical protein